MPLTATEFAIEAGVSQATVLAEIKAGRIAAVRHGGKAWSIEESELTRWLAAPRAPVGRPAGGVSVALSADELQTLRILAGLAEQSIEERAAVLLKNAIAQAWREYDRQFSKDAEWEGEIL